IEGSFNGELMVSDLLSLKSSAVIEGTVSVSKLAVEPGATFNASCNMKGKAGSIQSSPTSTSHSATSGGFKSSIVSKASSTSNEPAKAS
ncbi:MAG: polymer-forming cytoskeletal protein, partial [Maribacter sp.]|nr:polymer-forming cytoskeletal protein [Maribacter sp.]